MKKLLYQVFIIALLSIGSNINIIAQDDEFGEFESFEQADSSSDFQEMDEFGEFENAEITSSCASSCTDSYGCSSKKRNKNIIWVYAILAATVVTGFMVRFKQFRFLRGLILISSLVILGFYRGGCPCPIMSLQNSVLLILGEDIHWQQIVWFAGLIPITFVFGKVWCGWVCHLGALQELIFLPGKVKILQSARAQKIMRHIRIALLLVLIVQLFVTHTNLFKQIDPFKVAFNLRSGNITGWVLLALLIISSIFIYRPFCKTVCPIGLILGWVSKIPGASVIGVKGNCSGCISCNNSCKINAITRTNKFSQLENQECIACGDCLQSCNKSALKFFRKSKQHGDSIACERK